MQEQFYIMIMGERGQTMRYPCTKKKVYIVSAIALTLLTFLVVCTTFTVTLFIQNREIGRQLADLEYRVQHSDTIISSYKDEADREKLELSLEVANLRLDNANQELAHRDERNRLLSTAVSELNERSEIMATIFDTIGIKVPKKKVDGENGSGGPYIPAKSEIHDNLLFKADAYLDAIRTLPLGRPVEGQITSSFGKRVDPVNNRKSFHEGVDFRGTIGDKIFATGDGVVKRAFKNGSFGNYVEIDHKNGYITAYAHLQNYTVAKGDKVKRGQLIGQVGNTGRSTGPHLHYEIRYKKKPVNPADFMQVAELLDKATANAEKR